MFETDLESRARALILADMRIRKLSFSEFQEWMEKVVEMTEGGSMFFSISLTKILPILQKMKEEGVE